MPIVVARRSAPSSRAGWSRVAAGRCTWWSRVVSRGCRGGPLAGKRLPGPLGRGRQVSYLFLREVEPDSGVDPGHGADGDGDFLAAPQVPLHKQHVGHPVIARVDEEALHPPDLTIEGIDPVPGPHLLLTHRNNVFEDRRLPQRSGGRLPAPDYLRGFRPRDQVAFRGVVELVELRARAAQPDFPVRGLDQVHGDKPPGLLPVPRLDDKVGDRLSGRVDDQAAHLAAVTIRTACPGPDRELRLSGHSRLPSSCWTVTPTCPASARCGL